MRALLLLLLVSCATTPGTIDRGYPCDTILEGQPQDKDFFRHLESAREGCIKHFDRSYCIKRFIRKGPTSYYAICGRIADKNDETLIRSK